MELPVQPQIDDEDVLARQQAHHEVVTAQAAIVAERPADHPEMSIAEALKQLEAGNPINCPYLNSLGSVAREGLQAELSAIEARNEPKVSASELLAQKRAARALAKEQPAQTNDQVVTIKPVEMPIDTPQEAQAEVNFRMPPAELLQQLIVQPKPIEHTEERSQKVVAPAKPKAKTLQQQAPVKPLAQANKRAPIVQAKPAATSKPAITTKPASIKSTVPTTKPQATKPIHAPVIPRQPETPPVQKLEAKAPPIARPATTVNAPKPETPVVKPLEEIVVEPPVALEPVTVAESAPPAPEPSVQVEALQMQVEAIVQAATETLKTEETPDLVQLVQICEQLLKEHHKPHQVEDIKKLILQLVPKVPEASLDKSLEKFRIFESEGDHEHKKLTQQLMQQMSASAHNVLGRLALLVALA